MDARGSYLGKRSFSELEVDHQQRPEHEDVHVKKKLRTKLVDLFNRVSLNVATPDDYIKVYLRIKPFTAEENANQKCFVLAEEENSLVATAPEMSHAFRNLKRGLGNSSHKFTFSRIFNENTTQGDFFNATMLGMTKDFISGQNSLVFTYGVTSSGKTYTIQGQPQSAGILPRCLDVIFNSISGKQIPSLTLLKPRMFTDVVRLSPMEVALEKKIKDRTLKMSIDDDTTVMSLLGDEMESVLSDTATAGSSVLGDDLLPDVENRDREKLKVDVEDQGKILFGVWVSFAEIYNEQIFDLLEPFPRKTNIKRPILKISDDRNGNPYIKGLKEIHVETADEAYRLLTIGQRNLQTACTRLNHCSSRSHCMFNIKIVRVVDKDDPHIARVSMLSLYDLAGSERYSKTQATGDRLKEAGNINASLMTLGRCIETLRHNQLHRDQQRLVPFRDSKLTRMLQNYFNGSGRAVMIVNVSQCSSMFDDTLHVFKFSAIAKQVRYIEKPPEPVKKAKEKKTAPLPQRPSIEWEVLAPPENTILTVAQNQPLPPDDDDDSLEDLDDNDDDNSPGSCKNVKEMKAYIKTLELRNKHLVEMVQEEINAASNIQHKVRQEVTQAMMKQLVSVEETYSMIVKENNEEAQEIADERVKGIMAVYEQRLERIQRKVDEDDEWVSSLLYYQEKSKVEEKDAVITDLKAQIQLLQSEMTDSKNKRRDIGNSVLIETLTHKLQEANDLCKVKNGKIEELESLISEAGEVYNSHIDEISKLTEQKEKLQKQLSSVTQLESRLKEMTASCDSLKQSMKIKESEWKAAEENMNKKMESKDSTISSLQDECKELQDEIERLQDKMSQMDENSKYCNDLEISDYSEYKLSTCGGADSPKDINTLGHVEHSETSNVTAEKNEAQIIEEKTSVRESSHDEVSRDTFNELTYLKEEAAKKDKEAETLKLANEELGSQVKCLQSKIGDLVTEINIAREKYDKSVADTEILQKTIEQLEKDLESARQHEVRFEKTRESSQTNNQMIRDDLESLKKVHVELTNKVEVIDNQLEESGKGDNDHPGNEDVNATELTKQMASPFHRKDTQDIYNPEVANQSDDNEIVFKTKTANTTCESLKQENERLRIENGALQKAKDTLKERFEVLEDQLKDRGIKEIVDGPGNPDVNIADMVRQLEQKTTPFPKSSMSSNHDLNDMDQSDDTEVAFNNIPKTERSAILKTPSTGLSQNRGSLGLAVKIKDAELAIAALRSKLKREEDDYFKREQALIHGYTAEIENLKYELARLKSKVDVPGRALARGKRKATAIDTSTSSTVSDSIEISVGNDSKLINIPAEDGEKQSVVILCNELLEIQQQLESINAAYRQLQTAGDRNTTNSFAQDVVFGAPRNFQSAPGAFRSGEKFIDSILQFEMDEMRIKMSQQDDEMMISKTVFEKMKTEKLETEKNLKEVLLLQGSHQDKEILSLKGALEKEQELKETIEQKLQETVGANSQLHSEIKEQQEMIEQLKETVDSSVTAKYEAEQKLKNLTEQLISSKEELRKVEVELHKVQEVTEAVTTDRDNMKNTITNLMDKQNLQSFHAEEFEEELMKFKNFLKQAKNELKLCKEDQGKQEKLFMESETKLSNAEIQKTMLEETVKNKSEELNSCKEKLAVVKQKYNDVKENLEKTSSIKNDFESKLKSANEKLSSGEETMSKLKQEFDSRVNAMKQELSGEGQSKVEAITKLEKSLDDLKEQLKLKTAQLEKVECLRQEEGAEVSQKLMMLEREKKLAERKAADAKEKELEWQQKCKGIEHMKQLEQQSFQQLRTAAETMRKLSLKTVELTDKLAAKNKELDLLTEEVANLKSNSKNTDDLEFRIKELEQSLAAEKEQRQETQKNIQEYQVNLDIMKGSLAECEELMDQQDNVMKRQDDELDSLKSMMDSDKIQKDKLDRLISKKEIETANLNQQISKLEAEITTFRQAEKKMLYIEQICDDKLKKSQYETRELVEKIEKLEREKLTLEDKLINSEKHLKSEKKDIGEMEGRIEKVEKQKMELEKEIERMSQNHKMVELQMATDKQQRAGELEKSHLLEIELKHLQKEAEKRCNVTNTHNDDTERENACLKEELEKVKQDILSKQNEMDRLNETLSETTGKLVSQEKELKKQDRINKRNREEIENWKQEKDECVSKLEQLINKRQQENKNLIQEIEHLKKDNADLAKNVGTVTSIKDSVINDLRKINNTLSIQLARAQGMSSPPKMATPDSSVLNRVELIEDLDTTGHLEIDATPTIAAKKCRKRQGSSQHTPSSSTSLFADSEILTSSVKKSLRPIEEQNENSPSFKTRNTSPTKSSFQGRVAELASEVIASISPLTRSAKRQEKENKKKHPSDLQIPFDLASYVAAGDIQNENAKPYNTRKSSRNRTKTKHSVI